MQTLTIRCHPYAAVPWAQLEDSLTREAEGLRRGAPRAVIRLSRLAQQLPSRTTAIGWLLEMEIPENSPLLSRERVAETLADLRMLGIQPTALTQLSGGIAELTPDGASQLSPLTRSTELEPA